MLQQYPLTQLPRQVIQGVEAMRDHVLLVERELCHGPARSVIGEEQRVIAKPALATTLGSRSFPRSRHRRRAPPRHRRHDPRRPRSSGSGAVRSASGTPSMASMSLLFVCIIVAVLAGPARREDPGCAPEPHPRRGPSHRRPPSAVPSRRVPRGLDERVFGEGIAVLHGIGEVPQLSEGNEARVRHHGREDGLYPL